jgi:hypothetical protein
MKRNKATYIRSSKHRVEQNNTIQGILRKKEEPTIQTPGDGTLDSFEEPYTGYDTGSGGRKHPKNRFIIHIIETWPTYLISIVGVLALFFFVTYNIKIAEITKDISFLYIRLDDNTRKIEKISDELSSFRSDLKSLDSKFTLFIELFKQGGNSTLSEN